jgi:hypothetical protein
MMSRRTDLTFASVDDVLAEIILLRRGCAPAGNWSLEQTCWHLNAVMSYLMSPGPHAVPDTSPPDRETLQRILAGGQIPDGIIAPERAIPPAFCAADAADNFIQTVERFRTFQGPFAPHRLFGHLTLDEGRRLSMLHCARHLSFLVPVFPTA